MHTFKQFISEDSTDNIVVGEFYKIRPSDGNVYIIRPESFTNSFTYFAPVDVSDPIIGRVEKIVSHSNILVHVLQGREMEGTTTDSSHGTVSFADMALWGERPSSGEDAPVMFCFSRMKNKFTLLTPDEHAALMF